MAGIDKIAGTQAQYHELKDWLEENEPWFPWRIASEDEYENETQFLTISNFSTVEDFYLWHLCPFPWVKKRLAEQYGPDGPCSDLKPEIPKMVEQRRYTAAEVDSMRAAIQMSYMPYQAYNAAERSREVEDRIRTYMVGGVDPQEVVDNARKFVAALQKMELEAHEARQKGMAY